MTTITLPRATVEQALEALVWEAGSEPALYAAQTYKAIAALRAALAEDALDRLAENERALGIQMEAPRALAQQAEQQPMHPELRKMWEDHFDKCFRAIPVPEQPEPAQEPVAWMVEGSLYASKEVAQKMGGNAYTLQALYTAPPQRQPLTKERLLYIYNQLPNWGMEMDRLPQKLEKFARAIERAHGITDPQIEDRLARHGIPMPGDPK